MESTDNAEAVAAEPQAPEQIGQLAESAAPAPATDENAESSTAKTEEVIKTENTQRRFDELTGTIRQQQEEIARLKQSQTLNYQDPGAPKPEDYPTEEEFIRADAAYQATKNVVNMYNQQAEQQALQQQQFDQQQKISVYNQRVSETLEKTPDFQAVVTNSFLQTADNVGNLTPAAQAILEANNGPDIAYYVAKNPNIAMQLNALDPVKAGMMVAQLSSQLTVSSPNINEAPAPVGAEPTGSGMIPAKDETAEKIGQYSIRKSNSLRS